MTKRSSAPARALAAIAVVGGFVVVLVLVASALDSGGSDSSGGGSHRAHVNREAGRPQTGAAFYVVKNGDTLTAIAHKTGVSVVRIQQLNPAVDPQILISGEKLKLR